MRRLLLAALGAAGSMLMDLPALAQLSNTTSTFRGQIAETCEFATLPNNLSLNYDANQNLLRGRSDIDVLANSNHVILNISKIQVINEPTPYASGVTPTLSISNGEVETRTADKVRHADIHFLVNPNVPYRLFLAFDVTTSNSVENRFELPS